MNKRGIKRVQTLWTHLHNVNKGLALEKDELCRLSLLRVSSSKSLSFMKSLQKRFLLCFVLFCFFFFIDPWPHCEGAGRRWEWGFGGFS